MPLIGSDKPRRHAYEFAHRALFALAARDAGRFDGLAEAGKLDDALAWLWHDVGSRLTDEERVADVLFTAARYQDGARSIVVVALPPPEHISEAHFIAVVVCKKVLERYFVLEHRWNLDDSPSTWLGEWTEESHLSLGSGTPAGDEFGFLDLVKARLT